jgi:5'-methylthioinosine phosphorylase
MSISTGIIGGTGLQSLNSVNELCRNNVSNQYGDVSAPLINVSIDGFEAIFLARHGTPHTIPPHKVNYRANIYALKEMGVINLISVNVVGGITKSMSPGTIVLPHQIIDYTYSREHTFFEENLESVVHIDFTNPYSNKLRNQLIAIAKPQKTTLIPKATYAATQGPRLETAAEIRRIESDGCDIVGMTGMPEASLARELDINYVSICLVVNWAAGKSDELITMELIRSHIESGMVEILELIKTAVINQQELK